MTCNATEVTYDNFYRIDKKLNKLMDGLTISSDGVLPNTNGSQVTTRWLNLMYLVELKKLGNPLLRNCLNGENNRSLPLNLNRFLAALLMF